MKTVEKVIIVGGGFGGISAAKKLGNSDFEVILFDKTNHHLFQPLLYQVASAALSPGDIAVPIREVLSPYKNVSVVMDGVVDIHTRHKFVILESGARESFDYLILAVGAKHSYFGNEQWEKFAPGMKTLQDSLLIRNNLLQMFEEAERENKGDEQINLVVIGGGPTGVEMAGALAEISKQTLVNDFRKINSKDTKVYLIEGADQLLGMYPKSLAAKAQKFLEDLGVTILLNSFVTDITDEYVKVKDKEIKTKNIIWAAGNKASSLLEKLNTELDRGGRVIVNKDLSINNNSSIFVIGDAAHFKTSDGDVLPGLAPVAAQQGKHIAKNLIGSNRKPFKYFDKGSMATIGRSRAVMQFGSIRSSGFFAWLAWCFVHILFLIDFRNKLVVFTQWALSFVFNKRGVRIINKVE